MLLNSLSLYIITNYFLYVCIRILITKKIIHVVGANPNGGGVFTFKNIYKSIDNIIVYNYHDYQLFFKNLKSGDTVFFNVIKPSIPFLIMVFLRVL